MTTTGCVAERTHSASRGPADVRPQVNQANERYQQLRNSARSEGDAMARCFDASHKAYSSGDGARAKQLSNEGNEHKRRMHELNEQAADWIFKANNEDSGPNEVGACCAAAHAARHSRAPCPR